MGPCRAQTADPPTLSLSTLDPVLRRELRSVSPQAVVFVAAVLAGSALRPGVFPALWDYYVAASVARARRPRFSPSDVAVGRKIAAGGFGAVYRATLDAGEGPRAVILKKAVEFGPAEAWMNERAARGAPGAVAPFVAAFDGAAVGGGKRRPVAAADGGPLWLLWEDEGAESLFATMARKEWPYCAEPILFGRELERERGPRRRAVTLAVVARHLLESLDALHAIGIVHRDVKPQNVLLSPADGRAKLIDLGAAVSREREERGRVPSIFASAPTLLPASTHFRPTCAWASTTSPTSSSSTPASRPRRNTSCRASPRARPAPPSPPRSPRSFGPWSGRTNSMSTPWG